MPHSPKRVKIGRYMDKFRNLGLSDIAINSISKKGFEEPTLIQELAIPLLLNSDKDIIAQAQTGTGKTAVFGLAFLDTLEHNTKKVSALVVTPTRELAIQVTEEINSLTKEKRLKAVAVYGGQSYSIQKRQIREGADIIVGTPGRLIDSLNKGIFALKDIKYCVLDEADEMLNMGFIDDIDEILTHCGEDKRMLLFSATMPSRIMQLAKKFMKDHDIVRAKSKEQTTDLINQIYFELKERDKFEALCRIVDSEEEFYGIVFCRTKVDCDRTARQLSDRGYGAEALHGDLSQPQREKILESLRKKKLTVLVATDVAARGIDVTDLTHVINYALPHDPESYVHRIGRTGRAGKKGTAITFITPAEHRRMMMIQRAAKADIKKETLPEVDDVIKAKKEQLRKSISEIITSGEHDIYQTLAEEIMNESDPKEALAAVLKLGFADKFDSSRYRKIQSVQRNSRDRGGSVDDNGKVRLFITLGKRDNMKPALLASLIERQTEVRSNNIREIDIYDNFSFVTVDFKNAEIILDRISSNKKQSGFSVSRAENKGSGGGGGRSRSGGRGGSRGGNREGGNRDNGGGGFHSGNRRRRKKP